MERGRILVGAGLVIAGAAAATALAAGRNDSSEAKSRWHSVKTMVLGISADQRTLDLGFASGGCRRDRGRATADERSASVRVHVEALDPVGDNIACTLDFRTGSARLRLAAPLRGRDLLGTSSVADLDSSRVRRHRGTDYLDAKVPRVAGLPAVDAYRLLNASSLRPDRLGRSQRGREAVGTRPPAGSWLSGEYSRRVDILLAQP